MSGFYNKKRSGYTLIELVMAMGSVSFLMGGLAATIYISSRALDGAGSAPVQTLTAAETMADVMADLQYALSFSERTANAVTFQVPDRDGDETLETIRYSWSGTPGDPLLVEYNGSLPATLAKDVQLFDLGYAQRTMVGTGFAKGVLAMSFNGVDDYVVWPHKDEYLLDEGTIQLSFNAADVSGMQGLFCKDSKDFDTGGHVFIYLEDNNIMVRQQSTSNSYYLDSGAIVQPGQWYDVALSFGPDGMKLFVDTGQVDSNSYTGGLGTSSGGAGNYEPIVIGASQWASGDLVADVIQDHFAGEIAGVEILPSAM